MAFCVGRYVANLRLILLVAVLVAPIIPLFSAAYAQVADGTTTAGEQIGMGDFTLPIVGRNGLIGKDLTLSEFLGKVIALEFMAPWCPPCQQLVQFMQGLYEQYSGRGVVFVSVAVPWGPPPSDKNVTITQFLNMYNSSLTYVYDSTGSVSNVYNITSVPTLFVLSRTGAIAPDGRMVGTGGPIEQHAGAVIDAMLAQSIATTTSQTSEISPSAQVVTSTVTTSSVLVTVLQTTSNAYSSGYLVTAVPKGSTSCGNYQDYVFDANTGPISGTVTSNSTELTFEIAPISDFNTWAPNGVGIDCLGPLHAIYTYERVTSRSFSENLPSNGEYVLVFISTPANEAAYVNISMNYPSPHPYTVTMTSYTTSYAFQTPLQTQTSAGNPLTNISGFTPESLLIGFLLALAILIVKRSKKARLTVNPADDAADS